MTNQHSISPSSGILDHAFLCLTLGGWLCGLGLASSLSAVRLPAYELAIEAQHAGPTLELSEASQLSLALVPKESTTLLPSLCGFTWNGHSLERWSVPYRLAYGGTLFVRAPAHSLLRELSQEQSTAASLPDIKELVFIVSGRGILCHPIAASALVALDRVGEAWLGHSLSSTLGIHTMRLPVRLYNSTP